MMNFTQYFKHLFTGPHKNIQSDSHISWGRNVLFLISLTIITCVVALFIRIFLFPEGHDDYYTIGPLVEFVLFVFFGCFLIAMIPFSLINMGMMQYIVSKQNIKPPSFQKLFSDHTTLFSYVIVMSIGGILWIIHTMMFAYSSYGPFIIFLFAFLIYTIGSGYVLFNYLSEGSSRIIVFIYTIALMIIIIGLALLVQFNLSL